MLRLDIIATPGTKVAAVVRDVTEGGAGGFLASAGAAFATVPDGTFPPLLALSESPAGSGCFVYSGPSTAFAPLRRYFVAIGEVSGSSFLPLREYLAWSDGDQLWEGPPPAGLTSIISGGAIVATPILPLAAPASPPPPPPQTPPPPPPPPPPKS